MKMKPLTAFCALNMGQSPSSETYNEKNVGLPFFQGNADFGEVHPKVRIWCSSPVKVAASGDILISVRAPIGAMNIANAPCCIGRGLAALSPNPDTCVQEYLYYALQSRIDSLIAQGTGSTFKAIGKKTLEDTQIPAYSLDEQQIISDTLSETDQLISKAKAQVSLLDQLVKSRFVELFRECKDYKRLEEYAALITKGASPKWQGVDYCEKGTLFVTSENVRECYLDLSKRKYLDDKINEIQPRSILKRNDILINIVGASIGRAAVYDCDELANINQAVALVRVDFSRINQTYLMTFLNSQQAIEMYRKMKKGGARDNLSLQNIADLKIPVAPMERQKEFATFVAEVDKSKFSLKNGRKEACFAVKYIWESLCRGILI